LIGHGVDRVINDCGINDSVLILNQITVLFTGMAGRLGFNGGTGRSLRNRYFSFGHSGYFLTGNQTDDSFMRRFWLPLLTTNSDPELVDERKSDALSGIKLALLNNAEPIKVAVYSSPFVVVALIFIGLYFQADEARKLAETQRDRAVRALDRIDRSSLGIALADGWGRQDDPKIFKNKCYYYGDGGYLLSVSSNT
jgi:hypothetical protein